MNPNDASTWPVSLTPAQAAAASGLSLDTIYEQVRHGALPARRIGRAIRIRKEDLLAWLAPEPKAAPWLRIAR